MTKERTILIFILILIIGNIFFGYRYFTLQKELELTRAVIKTQQFNERVLSFINFFIKNVLKAEKEVDFETRLKLENMVRDLNDKEILNQWQKFTASKNEYEAQTEVKNLLELLVSRIKISS